MKRFTKLVDFKRFYNQELKKEKLASSLDLDVHLPKPEYDLKFLCNPSNRDLIASNIKRRKSLGNIDKILNLSTHSEEFLEELKKIPNLTHPEVLKYEGDEPVLLKVIGKKPTFNHNIFDLSQLGKNTRLLKTDLLGPVAGPKSYYLLGDLAELEQALIKYTLEKLIQHKFQIISVPDILPTEVVERCGLINELDRNLVFELEHNYESQLCLSGTAEMALAYKLANHELSYLDLPLRLAAVSRCFRAEISKLHKERGIYRVHSFTKVEMFACSTQEKSDELMAELISIQENLFNNLGLHFKILDMPPSELGAPAYRKIDIEAWMPGRDMYGEISSCSNCTDYQARRLNIKYRSKNNELLHVHTLNGTASAIPRMIIALFESNQKPNRNAEPPKSLVSYLGGGKDVLQTRRVPKIRPHKYRYSF